MSHVRTTQTTPPLGAATEGGRRPTGVAGPSGGGENHHAEDRESREAEASPFAPPNPETTLKPERRRFNKAYKLDLLRRADACSEAGQIGALLRREGLFSSHLANWRFQRSQGRLGDAPVKKRNPKPTEDAIRMRLLEHENARLLVRVQQAELIIDIQKKVSELLGIPLKTPVSEGNGS